ncbi:MAG: Endo-1,4-beta-xylanase A precursor [Firmicutes bacterium ADurb.Bin373]|nr:MAG: Endo-1,4-beta-xylanase A precursor [Firmicutes bacterium ADurb.Bin373]
MKIKYMASALVIFLIFTANARAAAPPPAFQDIEGSFAREAILQLTELGITSGLGPNEYSPAQSISRGHFVVLLARALGVQPYSPAAATFSDLPLTAPESGYVEAMCKLGLVAGDENKLMRPGDPLKRQDAAVLLARALLGEKIESPLPGGRYLDEDQIAPYAVPGVAYITRQSLMCGAESLFRPQTELTRAEAAVIAGRLLEIRKGQALTAFPVVSAQQMQIKTGETRKIAPDNSQKSLPFTTVYGLDDPTTGSISPEGSFSAGPEPGKATITVNAGYNSYLIHTSVASTGKSKKTTDKNTVIAAAYLSEEELTKGATYIVEAHSPDQGFQETEDKSYPGPAEGLTSRDETWTGFYRQQGRDILVDLQKAAPVTKISLEFMQEAGSGIYLPADMICSLSIDGRDWYHLGQVSHNISPAEPAVQIKDFTLTFPPVTARYVKLSFPVDVFAFARNLSIKGTTDRQQRPEILARAAQSRLSTDTYLQIPELKNILLVYTGSHGEAGIWTDRDFLPMLAYVDKSYSIEGKMFDTMLFLPYPDLACTGAEWDAYAADLFAPGAQLPALENTMARLNKIPDYQGKVNVILTMPYPDGQQAHFGALEGGGRPLCFDEKKAGRIKAAGDRLLAVRWFYDNLMDRWEQAGFKYLNLAGIYWYKESMDPATSSDIELVQDVARLVRNDGLKFFWIPFFGAHGYDVWRTYGFNHAFLQPNYYAVNAPPGERMENAAFLAKYYNLGLEIECDEGILYANSAYYRLFYKQLAIAKQLNLDKEASFVYYAGSKTLVKAWRSENYKIRSIYDDLYKWLNGTYNAPAIQ